MMQHSAQTFLALHNFASDRNQKWQKNVLKHNMMNVPSAGPVCIHVILFIETTTEGSEKSKCQAEAHDFSVAKNQQKNYNNRKLCKGSRAFIKTNLKIKFSGIVNISVKIFSELARERRGIFVKKCLGHF